MMGGLPCLSIGDGPPLIVLLFTPQAATPTGLGRRYLMRTVKPFTEHFTVHVLNRRPGLSPTTTMAELAAHYAGAIETTFTSPVNVLGMSTGGSLALQLAADRPDLVGRLVLGGTACVLGPIGKRAQRAYIERARRGQRPSPALAELVTESTISRTLVKALGWLADGRKDHIDAATMLNAEDGFDLRGRLHDVKAPTLLVQGEKDLVYPLELARQTACGIADVRLVVYPGRGHGGTFTDKRFSADALAFLNGN
ncbi:alpha/beta fold hydrolase [Streptosporangium subroseum]|uniref:alpha/beta fold hydrolase n=1 Tax=Streptosporangium subroseum TaxID=106412 RepID=UPI00308F9C8F|nr:alpha/beta hydrolase [Streptosporangium subroseum]